MSTGTMIGVALLCATQSAAQSATQVGTAAPDAAKPSRLGAYLASAESRGGTRILVRGKTILDPKDPPSSREPPPALRAREMRALGCAPSGRLYYLLGGADVLGVYDPTVPSREPTRNPLIASGRGIGPGEMRDPQGIAVDAQQPLRVLVADMLNHRIDIFGADGETRGSFGTRGSGEGQLDHPADVAVDARGHAFVADLGNDRIVEFDAQGKFVKSIGGRGSYPGLFASPSGIDVSGDQIFVADRDNHRVQVLGLDGEPRYEWGLHALRPREGEGKLHYPCDVAVLPDGGRAIVLEEMENRMQSFGPVAEASTAVTGERDTSAHYGGGCSWRGDVLALIEPSGPSISIFDLTRGTPIEITRFGRYGRGAGQMVRPSSVLLDERAEIVYVADPYASRISAYSIARKRDEPLRFERDLARLVRSVDLASPTMPLRDRWTIEPAGLALGANGEVLVADMANARVVVLGADLVPVRAFGVPIDPTGIAFDARSGRTYVVDPVARALAVVAPDGKIEKVVEAPASRPFDVAVGAAGSVWVTDRENGLLLKLTGDKLVPVETIADPKGASTDRLGRGELFKPEGISCDARGRIVVVEAGNHRFQLFAPDGTYLDMGGARFYTEAARTPSPPVVAHAWDNARTVATNGGTWRVLWRAKPASIPRGSTFAIEAWVFAAGDPSQPAKDVELRVDAWMPDHLHGMTRVPEVRRRDDGGFAVEGLLFHMSGTWELDFDVVAGPVVERAQTRVELE